MRKIYLFMNVTIDGYFEGPGHDISFFTHDEESSRFAQEQSTEGGALLFGHRTYELMASFWPTPSAQAMDPSTAKIMNETPKFVVSHEPFDPGWNNVTVISGDVVGQIKALKEQPGKDITILGSNMLCVSLMEAGLMDEFGLMVNPVAIGAGTPLFAGLKKRTNRSLVDVRQFKSGNVLLRYR